MKIGRAIGATPRGGPAGDYTAAQKPAERGAADRRPSANGSGKPLPTRAPFSLQWPGRLNLPLSR